MFVWKKTVPVGRVEHWLTRVGVAVPPARIAVITTPGRASARLEYYTEAEAEAAGLALVFGGRATPLAAASWQPASTPRRPIAIAGRMLIAGSGEDAEELRRRFPQRTVLCIPAAMAFGTGEHATTAMCLRLLAEIARTYGRLETPWDLLDLGTGSGILALAGAAFGADPVLAIDHDPTAIRVARENAKLNLIGGIQFKCSDLLKLKQRALGANWPVITANLFSELLIALLPAIRAAMTGDGYLIASGVLTEQTAEVERAARAEGLALIERRRRGKWNAFLFRPRLGRGASER